jgi:hypothetical protein
MYHGLISCATMVATSATALITHGGKIASMTWRVHG